MALKNHFRKPWTAPSDNTSTHGLEKPLPKASTSAFRQHKKHSAHGLGKRNGLGKRKTTSESLEHAPSDNIKNTSAHGFEKTTSESPEQRLPTIPRHMALKNHFRKPRTAPVPSEAVGLAPPAERSCRSWTLLPGAAIVRPVKTEPRSATNATAQGHWHASP